MMNLNVESWFQFSDMYELIRFMYKYIWQEQKVQPKKVILVTFKFYFLTIFALLKFENFLTLPNAELVHNDIYQKYSTMQISQSRNTKGKFR